MLCENTTAERINFAKRSGFKPGTFQPHAEPSDTAEQVKDIHASPLVV